MPLSMSEEYWTCTSGYSSLLCRSISASRTSLPWTLGTRVSGWPRTAMLKVMAPMTIMSPMIPTNRNTYSLRLRISGESSVVRDDLLDELARPLVRGLQPALHLPDEVPHMSPAHAPRRVPTISGWPFRNDRQSSGFLNWSWRRSTARMPLPGLDQQPVAPVRGKNGTGHRPPRILRGEGIRIHVGFQEQESSARQRREARGQGSNARTFLSMTSAGSSQPTSPSSLRMGRQ